MRQWYCAFVDDFRKHSPFYFYLSYWRRLFPKIVKSIVSLKGTFIFIFRTANNVGVMPMIMLSLNALKRVIWISREQSIMFQYCFRVQADKLFIDHHRSSADLTLDKSMNKHHVAITSSVKLFCSIFRPIIITISLKSKGIFLITKQKHKTRKRGREKIWIPLC